jgi:uncharacterized protein (TIGR03118 family)
MRKTTLSLSVAVLLAASCGAQPDTGVTTEQDAINVGPTSKIAGFVTVENRIANLPNTAPVTDPELVNAWGLAFNPKGPAWINANGRGLSKVYSRQSGIETQVLSVVVPPPKHGMPPSAPTGIAFNSDTSAFRGDVFIFATEDGTISGWQPSDVGMAKLRVDHSKLNAVYKGLAIGEKDGHLRIYAADFHNNRVDVFDENYHEIFLHNDRFHEERLHDRKFEDRFIPDNYAPFNIFVHNGLLFVSYAKQDAARHDDDAAPGRGFVDVYEPDGGLVERLIARGVLDSPWGMAVIPGGGDQKSETLLVGNFGDGRINAFTLDESKAGDVDATLLGALADKTTKASLVIDGLWALVFGPGAGGFDADGLYFTAGPNSESEGLFGEISFD